MTSRPLPPPSSPVPVARRLLADDHHGDRLRFWRGGFWRWIGPRWTELDDHDVRTELYSATEHAVFIDGDGAPSPWDPNRFKIANLLDAMKAVAHLPSSTSMPSWLTSTGSASSATRRSDAAAIVACNNGLLDVAGRRLDPHTPNYFNQVSVPFDYAPAATTPTRWLRFLDQLWPDDSDSVAALQEFFGYVISGKIDLHKILLLIGPTRAGKGVIARVLKALIGDGNAAGPTLASLGSHFGLSPLIGSPLAIVSDARLGGANVHQVVERLLSISGQDMLTIDRKYREPWTGTLPTRFVVISNELPRFGDASGAIANRMVILQLTRSFLGNENPALTDELLKELPGILNWTLDGLDRLERNGRFTEPASSRDAALALADLASPVSAFVRDRCTIDDHLEVPVNTVFNAWKEWCEDNGRDRPGTVQTFGRDLHAVIPGLRSIRPRTGDTRERRYAGLAIDDK